jgi:RNA polymerase sigma-70 factor (ECF subfamily)
MGVESQTDQRDLVAAAWDRDRSYVFGVAARILADPDEAEDVVQEAFARLALQRIEEIDDVRAWLVVVVRRIALDRLGAAHRRLSMPSGALDDRPVPGPEDRISLDDEVRRALGVVLDRLSPAERTSFLLHDVFGVPFPEIAALVGRSPEACRQLAARARRAIRQTEPTGGSGPLDPALAAVSERFLAACAGGDLKALAEVLAPDVSGWATLDGVQLGFASGVEDVSRRLLHFLGPHRGIQLTALPLEEGVGVLAVRRAEPYALVRLEIDGGLVRAIRTALLPG